MNDSNQPPLVIFDTTLRDGEQSAGAAMTPAEKMRIALQLDSLGVDVIEAGFPAASSGDLNAVKDIASRIRNSTVCALARANPADIDKAVEAVRDAARPRVHTFIASSALHMEKKLGMEPDEVVERAVAAVKRARQAVDDVEFSPEDAGRSEPDFLCRIVEATIAAGATTINIPDTVGYTLPDEFAALIKQLIERVPNSDQAVFSVHCHDDLGLAVANSLAAVQAGARQVECTINGIGERAGNAALEEIVMAIRTRGASFPCRVDVETKQLVSASRLVAEISGMPVQPNKAIIGANAFAHESGIHQDGVLKARATYEIMRAEDVGWESNRIQLGKLSGRNAFRQRLRNIGHDLDNERLHVAFDAFKHMADFRRRISDEDLVGIVQCLGRTPLAKPHLMLLRHAEAESSHPNGDFERPLTSMGLAQAKSFGELLDARGIVPDLLLVSAAERAKATAEQVLAGLGRPELPQEQKWDFYKYSCDHWVQCLRGLPMQINRVLVIGHNPAMSDLAQGLGASSEYLETCECFNCQLREPWYDLGLDPLISGELLRAERD